MKTRSLVRGVCIFLGLYLAATTFAVKSPIEAELQPVGDLSWMWSNRETMLLDPARWFGPEAATWRGNTGTGPLINFIASGSPFRPAVGVAVVDEVSARQALKEFALNRKNRWGGLEQADFTPLTSRKWRGSWQAVLGQTVAGIPVYGTRLEGTFDPDGNLTMLNARLLPTDRVRSIFALTENSALRRLTSEPSARMDFNRKILYPVFADGSVELRAAWQLRARTDRHDLCPAGIVDAGTGEVLLRYNDIRFDQVSGTIHGLVLPAYWNDPPQTWVQRHQRVDITTQGTVYSDTSGYYALTGLAPGIYPLEGELRGLYADVNNDAPGGQDAFYQDTIATSIPLNYTWNYTMARQDEANTYYHANLIHDWYKGLDSQYDALDYVMPVSVGQQFENAYWDGLGMTFGTGGMTFRNFALFCDVVYHEYTHGVTDGIYPDGMLPYTGQSGAMDEGWSDYFACTITNEPGIGEGGLQYSNMPLRNLDNNLVYPQNWVGEVHGDGRIFGGALWDLREALGAGLADTTIHFPKYLLAETWEDYFVDVLTTDDDDGNLANGGPHHPQIYTAFGQHGIGPGATPQLSISLTQVLENGQGGSQGNGDGFYDPGEILSMTFSVHDSRYLYPPPAENVIVTVWADDPNLIFDPPTWNLGQILPGSTVQAPESLLITVSPQANLSFSRLHFDVNANGGTYQISDSIEIIVGHPPLLLVDDDGTANYQMFLNNALRSWGRVFSLYNVNTQGGITAQYLNQFSVVIWMTGNQSQNTLTSTDQAALTQYLEDGRNLILTGQNLVEDIGQTSFFSNYLKCSPLQGDVNDWALDGVAGDPITDSTHIVILGTQGGNNQTSPASIAALPGAFEIYHYQHESTHSAGAVRYDGGNYKVVTYVFGLEAVSGIAGTWPLGALLDANLGWFGIPSGVESPTTPSVPLKFALGRAIPNPFNPSTALSYELRAASYVRLKVYDTAGRLVTNLVEGWRQAGEHRVTFDGLGLASGVYLYTLTAGGEHAAGKMVLLK